MGIKDIRKFFEENAPGSLTKIHDPWQQLSGKTLAIDATLFLFRAVAGTRETMASPSDAGENVENQIIQFAQRASFHKINVIMVFDGKVYDAKRRNAHAARRAETQTKERRLDYVMEMQQHIHRLQGLHIAAMKAGQWADYTAEYQKILARLYALEAAEMRALEAPSSSNPQAPPSRKRKPFQLREIRNILFSMAPLDGTGASTTSQAIPPMAPASSNDEDVAAARDSHSNANYFFSDKISAIRHTLIRPTPDHTRRAIQTCKAMNIQHFIAEYDAEQGCGYLVERGIADAIVTEDGDPPLFGCRFTIWNWFLQHGKPAMMLDLGRALADCGMTLLQLIDLGIMIGSDFCPGLPGISQKRANRLIREFGDLESILTRMEAVAKNEAPKITMQVPAKTKSGYRKETIPVISLDAIDAVRQEYQEARDIFLGKVSKYDERWGKRAWGFRRRQETAPSVLPYNDLMQGIPGSSDFELIFDDE